MKHSSFQTTFVLLATLVSLPNASAEFRPEDFVAIQRGTSPVILSAPHGGTEAIPSVPPRQGEGLTPGSSGFRTSRDSGTEALAYAVAKAIEAETGEKPYFVVARVHRKFVDPNRPLAIACEHPDAERVYSTYHATLAAFRDEVRREYGTGLLLDLHGQGSSRETVFRGTKNGLTVKDLIRRHGDAAHDGTRSLLGFASEEGWKTHPRRGGREQAGYTGGYIVQTYGSHHDNGIDAIQLEFGADYRTSESIDATAATLATAVDRYLQRYVLRREPVEARRTAKLVSVPE